MFAFLAALLCPPPFHGFEAHLREAIDINSERMVLHAASGRDVRTLYRALITAEKALRPVARSIDALAAPFVADGIPVVEADFVSMDGLPTYDAPTTAAPMTAAERNAAQDIVADLVWATAFQDLDTVTVHADEALAALAALEARAGVWFPMTRHVIESTGLAALHGMQHNCDSDGGTRTVVDVLVKSQLLGLTTLDATWFDEVANPHHVAGVGVLINDLPAIPFEAELHAMTAGEYQALVRCGN